MIKSLPIPVDKYKTIIPYLLEYVGKPLDTWYWGNNLMMIPTKHFICFTHEEDALAFKIKFGY